VLGLEALIELGAANPVPFRDYIPIIVSYISRALGLLLDVPLGLLLCEQRRDTALELLLTLTEVLPFNMRDQSIFTFLIPKLMDWISCFDVGIVFIDTG
jgi:hypothetical protein